MSAAAGRRFWKADPPAGAGLLEFGVLSALMLFWEICVIRWVSTEIRVFAYYKNLALVGAYLGFGIGLLTSARQERWLTSIVTRLAVLITLVVVYPVSPLRIDHAPAFFQEFTWHRQDASILVTAKFYTVILLVFCGVAASFVPWGRRIGFYFEVLRPIPAYSINVSLNLVGIALFSALSVAGSPPLVWVAAGLLPLLLLQRGPRPGRLVLCAVAAVPLALTAVQLLREGRLVSWSPYYKIAIVPPRSEGNPEAFHLLRVNHDYHQRILDLRPETLETRPSAYRDWALAYDMPYQVTRPQRVLVVGAGTGNDAAAALRAGARSVVAVEIDPVIYHLGSELHPERPYADPRVSVHLGDARTYLSHPSDSEPFDLVVFGLLDSHTQVSGMNSLRLDNFIYTVESLRQAKALLEPRNGLLALSFSAAWGDAPWTLRRIDRMLTDVFGRPPRTAVTYYDAGVTFLAGPGAESSPFFGSELYSRHHAEALKLIDGTLAAEEPPATDDWPFLYLKDRAVPLEQWTMMALIVAVAAVWLKGSGASLFDARAGTASLHFFLLGAAFLLIEVKNLVALSLLFGSTWQVNNLAIGAVLVMILVANLLASRAPNLSPRALYGMLLAVLLAGCFVDAGSFQHLARPLQVVIVPIYLSIPIFIAGLVFIRSFARAPHPASALGANILGGIFGGMLENASLALGISALQVLALVLYALSWAALREPRAQAIAEPVAQATSPPR